MGILAAWLAVEVDQAESTAPESTAAAVVGLVLAAGAGRRMGTPKAVLRTPDGTSWLERSVTALRDGGCAEVAVVLGAGLSEAAALLDGVQARVIPASGWAEGVGASLRAGLEDLLATCSATSVAVTLVDLPDVDGRVVRRVTNAGRAGPHALRRAAYRGVPGHPVLVGREHWRGIVESLQGDSGARDYLDRHGVVTVECGDLASGHDVDTPEGLDASGDRVG